MLLQEAMSPPPIRLAPDSSMLDAVQVLTGSQESYVMVADERDVLVGVLSEGDLIRVMLPDMDEIHAAGGSVADAISAFMRRLGSSPTRRTGPSLSLNPRPGP